MRRGGLSCCQHLIIVTRKRRRQFQSQNAISMNLPSETFCKCLKQCCVLTSGWGKTHNGLIIMRRLPRTLFHLWLQSSCIWVRNIFQLRKTQLGIIQSSMSWCTLCLTWVNLVRPKISVPNNQNHCSLFHLSNQAAMHKSATKEWSMNSKLLKDFATC